MACQMTFAWIVAEIVAATALPRFFHAQACCVGGELTQALDRTMLVTV